MIGIIVMLCIMHYYTCHRLLISVSTFTLHKPPLVIGQDRAGECRHGLLDEIRCVRFFPRPSLSSAPLTISVIINNPPTMLHRSITASALRVGTSRPILARSIATAVPLLRQQERRE